MKENLKNGLRLPQFSYTYAKRKSIFHIKYLAVLRRFFHDAIISFSNRNNSHKAMKNTRKLRIILSQVVPIVVALSTGGINLPINY